MSPILSEKVQRNTDEFLRSYRLGVDFGDKAHGIALLHRNEIVQAATLLDESRSDLEQRRQLRRGRRARESRRQRLARLRQWCLRNRLPDPDPYFNREINSVLWPPDRHGKPTSALARLSAEQRKTCQTALNDDNNWKGFQALPPEAIKECALINPFIARRLAREAKAIPLIFVRALWHLFEHRGFDWYDRVRGDDDDESDFMASKTNLIRHLKTLVITSNSELVEWKGLIHKRDNEACEKSTRASRWLDDPTVQRELDLARSRGESYPTNRRLNSPRHYVQKELHECLRSLPVDQFGRDFGRKKDQPQLSTEAKREIALRGLKKLLNWNRREPRFDNRQLRGCTWCAARGIARNTPRKKNVVEWQVKAAIRDIKVAIVELTNKPDLDTGMRTRVAQRQRLAIASVTRWLDDDEYSEVLALVKNPSLNRDSLKKKLNEFFAKYARLPKRVFVQEGQRITKRSKPVDPYQWHREELLNLADALHKRHPAKGRSRLCENCLKLKAETSPDKLQPPIGEAEVVLSQRALKARCDRLITWIRRNLKTYPVEYIRIEAVLPRPEEKARWKAQAGELDAEQSPKARLKFRLMEELGARCNTCKKPYRERERKGVKSKRDERYCLCERLDLYAPCAYCGKDLPAIELQIEHIYPKNPINTAGGIGPDAQINKTVACEQCNQKGKKDRLPFDYFQNILGGNSWVEWKRRVRLFNWRAAKRKISLLEEYNLPEDLAQVPLAHTRLVHRYLRQTLTSIYFSSQVTVITDDTASREAKEQAKAFLDWHISTPAGWMTSQCRLDWEHQKANGNILPLVPRKSPMRTSTERERDLERRLTEEPAWKHDDIRRGFRERAKIEEELRKYPEAVCDRTNLNQHWIDAAVLASLPPQANQPLELGGVWVRQDKNVRADIRFAPQAASYLKKWTEGSVIFDLRRHTPSFSAQQQETSLYGNPRPEAKIPQQLYADAEGLPREIFELKKVKNSTKYRLQLRPGVSLTLEGRKEILNQINNPNLKKPVSDLFEKTYEYRVKYEPIENLKVKDREDIVSDFWRYIFGQLSNKEYDFPKKRSRGEEQDDEEVDDGKERRRPKQDETLPPEAWKIWAEEETERVRRKRRSKGKSDDLAIKPPRRLNLYFRLSDNEKVDAKPTEARAPTKRGIVKPRRVLRLTSVGSRAVFDPESGKLHVSLNPWKSHVEQSNHPEPDPEGLKIFKGDCIWLERGKKRKDRTGAGWYRVTEMSPRKQRLSGEKEPEIKLVPTWIDLNQWVERERVINPKANKNLLEVDIKGADLAGLHRGNKLRIKRKSQIPSEVRS